jgi:hypothetical protein
MPSKVKMKMKMIMRITFKIKFTNFIEIEEALLNYKNDNLDIRHGS